MKNLINNEKFEIMDGFNVGGGYQPKPTKIEQHKLDLISELEKMSFTDRVFHYRKYSKLRNQLNNHQQHFPELYL